MSSTETRMPWSVAIGIGQQVLALLEPACERIVLAGSIRRSKPDIGDIEILAISKPGPAGQQDLFGAELPTEDALTLLLRSMIADGRFELREDVLGRTTFGPSNKLLLYAPHAHGAPNVGDVNLPLTPVDVFTADAANWGMALVVRTGPAEFNIRLMARFRQLGKAGHAYGGVTERDGAELTCPEEETVFRLAEWAYVPPTRRESAFA